MTKAHSAPEQPDLLLAPTANARSSVVLESGTDFSLSFKIREAFCFGSRQLKVAEMDGRAGAQKKTKNVKPQGNAAPQCFLIRPKDAARSMEENCMSCWKLKWRKVWFICLKMAHNALFECSETLFKHKNA